MIFMSGVSYNVSIIGIDRSSLEIIEKGQEIELEKVDVNRALKDSYSYLKKVS